MPLRSIFGAPGLCWTACSPKTQLRSCFLNVTFSDLREMLLASAPLRSEKSIEELVMYR